MNSQATTTTSFISRELKLTPDIASMKGVVQFMVAHELRLLDNLEFELKPDSEKFASQEPRRRKKMSEWSACDSTTTHGTGEDSRRSSSMSTSLTNEEELPTPGSVQSPEVNQEAASKVEIEESTRSKNQKILKNKLEALYTFVVTRLVKKLPMVSEYTFIYTILLFKRFMRLNTIQFFPSYIPAYLPQPPQKAIVTLLRVFKACFYLSYKVIEDEFTLFLCDFCKLVKEEKKIIEKLEVFIMAQVLEFDLKGLTFEAVLAEKKTLEILSQYD